MYNNFYQHLIDELAKEGYEAHVDKICNVVVEKMENGLYPHLIIAQEPESIKMFPITSYGQEMQKRMHELAGNTKESRKAMWDQVAGDAEAQGLQATDDTVLYITNPANKSEYLYLSLMNDCYCDIKGNKCEFYICTDDKLDPIVDNCFGRAIQITKAEEIMN